MSILKDKLIKVINCIKNKSYLRSVTGGIGEVVEEEDKFICYVQQKKIKSEKYVGSKLYLSAYNSSVEHMKDMFKFYKVNKPIYYIFDGIKLDRLILYSYGDSHVIFKNCEFHESIIIRCACDVTFENNSYYDHTPIYYFNSKTFFCGEVKNLKFINDNFFNRDEHHHICKFGMDIKCNNIEFLNSYVFVDNSVKVNDYKCGDELGEFSVTAKNGVFYMSNIEAPNIFMEMDNIVCDGASDFVASKGIIIDSKNDSAFLANIDTSYLVWNGKELINNDGKTIVNNKDLELQMSRVKLIEELKAIRDEANKINQERLNRVMDVVKEELDSKTLKRLLRK